MARIFHERQDGALCAQHALNCLLQGPYVFLLLVVLIYIMAITVHIPILLALLHRFLQPCIAVVVGRNECVFCVRVNRCA